MRNQAEGRGATSPVVVFICLLAVLAVVAGGVIWAGQADQKPIPPGPVATPDPTEDHTLTDAEAIARFKELDALRQRAFEERSAELARSAFTSQSPALGDFLAGIRKLRRENAVADEHLREISSTVTAKSAREVSIDQVILLDITFRDAATGDDITQGGGWERQVVEWTLQREGNMWLLHDGVIVAARRVRGP